MDKYNAHSFLLNDIYSFLLNDILEKVTSENSAGLHKTYSLDS